jgi:hypothetical protein
MRLLLAALLITAAAACGGDDSDTESSGSASAPAEDEGSGSASAPAEDEGAGEEGEGAAGEVVELTIGTDDYSFDAEDELEGGIVELTLTNEGEQTHEAGFIKVPADYDVEAFAEDFGPVIEGGPIPEQFETITGAGEVEAGEELTSTITLPEGDWVLFCALSDEGDGADGEAGDDGDPEGGGDDAAGSEEDAEGEGGDAAGDQNAEGAAEGVEGEEGETEGAPAHYTLGMLQMVSVTGGADVSAADIESDGLVEAVDYGFEVPQLEAGKQTLTFENTSEEQLHHAIVFGFEEGIDEAAAEEAFKAMLSAGPDSPPPAGTPEPDEVGFSYVFGPGNGGTFEVELESGRTYAVVCFIQDRTGGPPHAIAHEMVEFFTVE